MAWDLDEYRREAEVFLEEIDREYYLQGAGHKPDLAVEPIYERHAGLFEREAVERVGEARRRCEGARSRPFGDDEEQARLRYLHQFALDGHLGRDHPRAWRRRTADLEASLEVEVGGEVIPYRMAPVVQANEPDSERRAEIEAARNAVLAERLNPLAPRGAREVARGLHGRSAGRPYLDAYSDVRALDLRALAAAARVTSWRPPRPATPAPSIRSWRERSGDGWASCGDRTSPVSFVPPTWTALFPAEAMVPALRETLAGLGIDLDAQSNVTLDTEARPTKSPRAFCSTPRVPEEVYLVMPPIGGREDYAALFHEAGHAEHYGCTDAELAFEFRHLGDNACHRVVRLPAGGADCEPEMARPLSSASMRRRRRSSMPGRPGW